MERFYKIGEVAEMLGIEQHTLRYLENSLKIKIKRDERGDRMYSEADLDTLRLVLKLKEKGLNTTAIKLALETAQDSENSQEPALVSVQAENQLKEMVSIARRIIEQNDELMRQNRRLEERMASLEKKIQERNLEREKKIDEFLNLWKAEQESKSRSWLSWLRGK
ncbi:MAG: MerR family transcriptional regulator [Syntrophomonadaceae bacterium]|jgi:DNA-binding transcriptional MerR regulator